MSTPPDRRAAARALQAELIRYKRSLGAVQTGVAHLRPAGITPAGIPLLRTLADLGPQRAGALATHAGLDASTVSRHLDALVRAGLAERVPDPDDGRATLVKITEGGRRQLQDHLERVTDLLDRALVDWDVADVHTLATLLGRLNDLVAHRLTGLVQTPDEPQEQP